MATADSPKEEIPLNKEDWFILFLALMRKVFPETASGGMGFFISFGKNFPEPPASQELRSYYETLRKVKDLVLDNFEKFKSESAELQTLLALTTEEVGQLKELLLTMESDPVCEDHTRVRITKLRDRLNT